MQNVKGRYSAAMVIPRKACICGGRTIIEVVPDVNTFNHDWYVKCLNSKCQRSEDILFKDPVEAVEYWNRVGYKEI